MCPGVDNTDNQKAAFADVIIRARARQLYAESVVGDDADNWYYLSSAERQSWYDKAKADYFTGDQQSAEPAVHADVWQHTAPQASQGMREPLRLKPVAVEMPRHLAWEHWAVNDFDQIKAAGADGWELVTVVPAHINPTTGSHERQYFYLKRPVV